MNNSPLRKRCGRPRDSREEIEITLHLRLRRGRDDDLIAFFAAFPPGMRVAAFKMAFRNGTMVTTNTSLVSDDDLDNALEMLLF